MNEFIDDWRLGIDPEQEQIWSKKLIEYFQSFVSWCKLEEKSETTKRRYYAALSFLGGYIIDRKFNYDEYKGKTSNDIVAILRNEITPYEGPLISSNPAWQNEIDTVCRKIHKHLDNFC